MSARISRYAGYSLAALSAALSFHQGNATAGEPSTEARSISTQAAVQDVLSGHHPFHGTADIRTVDGGTAGSPAGTRDYMQQVLLGPSRFHMGIAEARDRSSGSGELAPGPARPQHPPADIQAAVQRVLRGDHASVAPGA
jgi:hypothetical protein